MARAQTPVLGCCRDVSPGDSEASPQVFTDTLSDGMPGEMPEDATQQTFEAAVVMESKVRHHGVFAPALEDSQGP